MAHQGAGVRARRSRASARLAAAFTVVGTCVIAERLAAGGGGAGSGASDVPPCPFNMEIPCDESNETSSGAGANPGVTCACGPGMWVRMLPVFTCVPEQGIAEVNVPVSVNGTSWLLTREAAANPGFAEVHVAGYGSSHFWRAGSVTRSAAARYSVVVRESWQGVGVPCPRVVSLAATGGGGLMLTLSCSAAPGCGASGTTSISGSCSSLGDASAYLDNKKVDGGVAYNAGSTLTDIRGDFGASIDDSSASVEGRISRTDKWSVRGAGNVSGSATYTVRDDRSYCAFTNRTVTRRAVGVAICAAGATVDDNGTASFDARAFVDLVVN